MKMRFVELEDTRRTVLWTCRADIILINGIYGFEWSSIQDRPSADAVYFGPTYTNMSRCAADRQWLCTPRERVRLWAFPGRKKDRLTERSVCVGTTPDLAKCRMPHEYLCHPPPADLLVASHPSQWASESGEKTSELPDGVVRVASFAQGVTGPRERYVSVEIARKVFPDVQQRRLVQR